MKYTNKLQFAERGIGKSIGSALLLGFDGVLANQKFVKGSIETGGLFVKDLKDKICQPYPGTASPVTQIIEAENNMLRSRRIDVAGRTYYSEGKPGFMYFEEKANSMTFWINEHLRHVARTLSDFGVNNISGLRTYLEKESNPLRILSERT